MKVEVKKFGIHRLLIIQTTQSKMQIFLLKSIDESNELYDKTMCEINEITKQDDSDEMRYL